MWGRGCLRDRWRQVLPPTHPESHWRWGALPVHSTLRSRGRAPNAHALRRQSRGRGVCPPSIPTAKWHRGEQQTPLFLCFGRIPPWAHIFTRCSAGRFRIPLALAPKKSVALQAARRPSADTVMPMGQVPPTAAMVSTGGQQEAGAWGASMTVVGQLATIVALTSTAGQTDSLAAWAVQTEHASVTLVMEVA
jgi:hypothetical protein